MKTTHHNSSTTSKAAHTPGPLPTGWKMDKTHLTASDGNSNYVRLPDGKLDRLKIETMLDNYGFYDHARRWHLTTVEAASPALLEALEGVMDVIPPENERYTRTKLVMDQARKAISQARGEA